MRKSVLFARVFKVVLLSILLTVAFTTIVYTYISQNVFTQVKENELLPKARALGDMLVAFMGKNIDESLLGEVMDMSETSVSLLGAYAVVTNADGDVVAASNGLRTEYMQAMTEAAPLVIRYGELRTAQIPALRRTNVVGVGVPITRDGHTVGAVMMLVSSYEAMVAMGSLNGALAMSLLLSLPFVAAMIYFVIGRIVTPLRQMRDVALNMAGGHFEARADTGQRGEIGQLGRSLNYLSDALSRSISALVLERNRMQKSLDGLREGILAVDADGRVTLSNPAIRKLFETLPAPQGANERMALIPDEGVWADFDRAVRENATVARVLALPDRTLQISISPLPGEADAPEGAVGLFSDVTEAERLERTRRDYVANVSHEMRTPLTAMRALLEPLSEGMVKDEAVRRRYYSIMLRETMRLSRLINDLMELSRLQSGALKMELTPVSVRELAAELSEKYAGTAADHALTYCCEVPEDCPAVVSNPDRLEQILVILIDNAMKYTPEGGRVTLSAAWNHEQVTLSVADTGIGIDPADQPYVFDRFYKVDKAHTGLGSGLGLSIASELIKVMGERIWVKSTPGEGSVFSFTQKIAR